MLERRIRVSRQARYYLNGAPAASTRYLWFVCHGYGQLAQYFLKNFDALDPARHLVVAPEALSRFYLEHSQGRRVGATWMTREDREREIEDYVQYLDNVYDAVMQELAPVLPDEAPPLVKIAFGFSQGATTVSRWAFQGKMQPQHLVLWAGELPHDLNPDRDLRCLQALDVWMALGDEDPWITPEKLDALRSRYHEMGISYQMHDFFGKHTIPAAALQALAANMLKDL